MSKNKHKLPSQKDLKNIFNYYINGQYDEAEKLAILITKKFSKDWENAKYEKGETQTFYNEFFEVFGVKRRNVAIYEKAVKKLNNLHGFIDLFWEGKLFNLIKKTPRTFIQEV